MANFLKKRSVSLPIVINAGVSSLILALGMTPTFSSFTASITGDANSVGTGAIVMRETDSSGTITCLSTDRGGVSLNTASCSSVNKYGGNLGMLPGQSEVVVTYIADAGTVDASSFSLTPSACVQSGSGTSGTATDLCSKIAVSITSGPSSFFSGTASALAHVGTINLLAGLGIPQVKLGVQIPITVTTTLDVSVDNSYQGLTVSQPLTWTFGS